MATPAILHSHFETVSECPLCSSGDGRELFKLDSLRFNQCPSCRFRFMNPALTSTGMGLLYENSSNLSEVNQALEGYYEYEAGRENSQTREDYVKVLRLLEQGLPATTKPKLFEVGFGNGAFLAEAQLRGWEVGGLDTSTENCHRLREEKGIEVEVGNYSDFNPAPSSVDAVAFWDVIEHTTDPRGFIQKAFTMLAPGGKLILATPNIGGLLNLVAEFIYFVSFGKCDFAVRKLYVLEHVGYFNRTTLSQLVQEEGFVVDSVFLSETDLDRYEFSSLLRFGLRLFFGIARFLRMQNRIILIAKKIPQK